MTFEEFKQKKAIEIIQNRPIRDAYVKEALRRLVDIVFILNKTEIKTEWNTLNDAQQQPQPLPTNVRPSSNKKQHIKSTNRNSNTQFEDISEPTA